MKTISCVLSKILSIIGMVSSIGLLIFPYYIGSEFGISFIPLFIICSATFIFFYLWLLKTNDPISRYNIFSLNPKWLPSMKHSMGEDPGQIFKFDAPDPSEVKRRNRKDKLDKLGI